jgi:quercetin dioxygenase-like cupin family protein
MICT